MTLVWRNELVQGVRLTYEAGTPIGDIDIPPYCDEPLPEWAVGLDPETPIEPPMED